jgi:hypothetical protein
VDSTVAGGVKEAPPATLTWPEGGELIAVEGVLHCERCGQPAGRWVPPLDEHGHRVLGSDPRGWHPAHGPDVGLACCRTLVCYDARPGHQAWPK